VRFNIGDGTEYRRDMELSDAFVKEAGLSDSTILLWFGPSEVDDVTSVYLDRKSARQLRDYLTVVLNRPNKKLKT